MEDDRRGAQEPRNGQEEMKSLREMDGGEEGCREVSSARNMTRKRGKKLNAERNVGTERKEVTGRQNVGRVRGKDRHGSKKCDNDYIYFKKWRVIDYFKKWRVIDGKDCR